MDRCVTLLLLRGAPSRVVLPTRVVLPVGSCSQSESCSQSGRAPSRGVLPVRVVLPQQSSALAYVQMRVQMRILVSFPSSGTSRGRLTHQQVRARQKRVLAPFTPAGHQYAYTPASPAHNTCILVSFPSSGTSRGRLTYQHVRTRRTQKRKNALWRRLPPQDITR